jgi:hypothetical protein
MVFPELPWEFLLKSACFIIFFLFLQTKPSFSPLFAWSKLDISASLDSVSAVFEGYQLNYCWILKLLSGPTIFVW